MFIWFFIFFISQVFQLFGDFISKGILVLLIIVENTYIIPYILLGFKYHSHFLKLCSNVDIFQKNKLLI